MKTHLKNFFLPKADKQMLIRILTVAAVSFILFGLVIRPFYIKGHSMHPTYRDGQFLFGFRQKYLLRDLKHGDVVMVQLAGTTIMYLKRVVAFPGDTVEFRQGTLYINGTPLEEPYINGTCTWQLPARQVDPGFVYVIGDNRSMPIEDHHFGAVLQKKIYGGPLW